MAHSIAQPRGRESWDLCEISWWRGYVKSEFYASAIGADGSAYEVSRSPQFRWHRSEAPPRDNKHALAAHKALVEELSANGWEPFGESVPWFAQRFRRLTTGLRLLQTELAADATGEEDSAKS